VTQTPWRQLKEDDVTENKIMKAIAALPAGELLKSVFVPDTSVLRAQANAAAKPVFDAALASAIADKKPSVNAPDVEVKRS
jgi:hypothetical protein